MKFLEWTMLLVVITTKAQDVPDIALILQQANQYGLRSNANLNMTCVVYGNSMDSAITWNEPISSSKEASKYVSDYVPPRESHYNCELDNAYEPCTNLWTGGHSSGWSLKNSLDSKLEPVTDQRWEDFPITRTEDNIIFKKLATVSNTNRLKIHFSVRAQEAHICLCDGVIPPESNCYYIILNGWKGQTTALRKCSQNKIPSRNNEYPRGDCQPFRSSLNHTSEISNTGEWRHFTIEKNNNNILLWGTESDAILNYTDTDRNVIDATFLRMRSPSKPAFWKLHDYSFIASHTPSTDYEPIGPVMISEKTSFCASIFVAMCQKCTLIIRVLNYNNPQEVVKETLVKPRKGLTWHQEKITVNLTETPSHLILAVSKNCNECKNPFWALDKFQVCSENEVRVLKRQPNQYPANCQAVKYSQMRIQYTSAQTDRVPETTCQGATFGRKCMNCASVFGNDNPECAKSILCDLGSDGGSICGCSNGYTGEMCQEECPEGSYGYQCKERCGYCSDHPCNVVSGKCASGLCTRNFLGVDCKTAPSPILLNAPEILERNPTSLTVRLRNLTYVGLGRPVGYEIEYKEHSETEWNKRGEYHITNQLPIEIKKLAALTRYDVRAILIAEDKQTHRSDIVPTVAAETTCAFIEEKEVRQHLKISNTSAIFSFTATSESCRNEDYELEILYRTGKENSKALGLELTGLDPYTDYSIKITNRNSDQSLTITFKTLAGAATQVQQLRVTESSANSATVSWNAPTKPNGKIEYYKVEYQLVRYLGCQENIPKNNNQKKSQIETRTSTTIQNLEPYAEYRIEVSAFTVMDGEAASSFVKTKQTAAPQEEEFPTITHIEAKSTSANIYFQQPDCKIVRGTLKYYFTWRCANEWCHQLQSFNITPTVNQQGLSINKLLPYSNYTVKLKVGYEDVNTISENELSSTFNTASSIPNEIGYINVYSQDETSVSLSFLPPYPPTGEASEYFVTYSYTEDNPWYRGDNIVRKSQTFMPTQCSIWKAMHCIELQVLESHQDYNIIIQAKNRGTNFNKGSLVPASTKQSAPEAPKNISAVWDDYDNLTITWIHPDKTNGPLIEFMIYIQTDKGPNKNFRVPVNKMNYSLTYTFQVPLADQWYSSKLRINACAKNKISATWANAISTTSPPKTPSFTAPPFVEDTTNTTITINLPAQTNIDDKSWMYIIVSTTVADSVTSSNTENIKDILEKANIPLRPLSWIATEFDLKALGNSSKKFIVGDNTTFGSTRLTGEIHNQPLLVRSNYTITVLLVNEFEGREKRNIYKVSANTYGMQPTEKEKLTSSTNYALLALLLLLIIPGIVIWIVIRKNKESKLISWDTITNMTTRSARGPDVIPLTTATEKKKPVPPTKPIQVKAKQSTPLQPKNNTIKEEPSASAQNDMYSKPVKIMEFEQYVKESIESGELERQHKLFPRGQTKPWDYGCLPENKSKNRYNNLIAYDHSRVKLARINNDKFSDYINANYVQGYNSPNAYIATQGPKVATVDDFWRMIWQENVNYIVMLANIVEGGKKKTEQYWPNVNEFLEFGKIRVEYISSRIFADYEYRTFLVTCDGAERRVEQMHFTSWPDHGVPLYPQSLVPFLRKLLTVPQGTSPIVVHCSAGVGRTGTIILCDLCLRMAAREGVVDVLKHQHNIREQRANLVDNIEQYKLAHLVLLECLVAPQTSVTCDEQMEAAVLRILDSKKLGEQMQYLSDTAWQDQAMRPPIESEPNPAWASKNRFQDIIPSGYGRIFLSRYPLSDEHSDYINAVEVNGFRCPQRFIVTQQPLPRTVADFWRMVDEKEITTIVSLNKINTSDETSCIFWPTRELSEIHPVPYMTLKFHKKTKSEHYNTITIHLYNQNQNNSKRIVQLLILKGWPANELLPSSEESLLKLWEETERISRNNSPIVASCYDGASASGLFLSLSFIVEQMKLEQQCDVCLAVRNMRHNRKQFVTETEQFAFLYRAALAYLSSFDLYSNFTPTVKK